MSDLRVVRHPDAQSFLDAAEPWLLEREDENNLLLGIAASLVHSTAGYGEPIYLATIEVNGEVAGCAFRTPPFKLGLTRLPEAAASALVADLGKVFQSIPAVLGPIEEARDFGDAWAAEKDLYASPGRLQRIYSLREVRMPPRMASGFMRPAVPADLPLITDWLSGFLDATGMAGHRGAAALAEQLVGSAALAFWEDGGPVAMAGFSGRTPHSVRVSYVFTPEGNRGKGYASALVAHLSRYLLEQHFDQCVLYTDLSNPTSNGIYRLLGYQPVCDVMDVEFHPIGEAS